MVEGFSRTSEQLRGTTAAAKLRSLCATSAVGVVHAGRGCHPSTDWRFLLFAVRLITPAFDTLNLR